MDQRCWILLTYKVPPEPSRKRMALWRKIKGMGAVYLQNGVCVLPKTDEHLRSLKILEHEIGGMNGEAVLLETAALDRAQEEKILARFNQDRDEAYHEFLEQCEAFEAELAKERSAGKFTFAELEENDEDLKKLRIWHEKIRRLDFYGANLAKKSAERLQRCEALLDDFSREVFEAQDENRWPREVPS